MKTYDFLILGAGIFGVTTALELKQRGYSVGLLNPDHIPHPLAASTDISKVVRMEYGTDMEYMEMLEPCLEKWRAWNDLLGETLYHETGFILATTHDLEEDVDSFEGASYRNLLKKGYQPQRFDAKELAKRFPAFETGYYTDGFYHALGGFAESGRVVHALANYAQQLGVELYLGQTAEKLIQQKGRVVAVETREGNTFSAGHVVVCTGNFTPYLLPELKPYMRVTGHPVFHIKPNRPELFTSPNLAVFTADISKTGWYGFPLHPKEKVVKVALHSEGLELDPAIDERVVSVEEHGRLQAFLNQSLPALANDPVVFTRRCCYTDTLDGHFWIDRHPEIEGLSIGSGGSGHGLKMGPILGELIADAAEGKNHKWGARHRWRHLSKDTPQVEEARHKST